MTERRLTGRHVLLIFMGFFVTIVGANAAMVTFALKTFSGTDVDGAYLKGLEYNKTLEQRAAEAQTGYAATVEAARDGAGLVQIAARYRLGGVPADGLTVAAVLRHPANAHLDRALTLTASGDGFYRGDVADLPAGQWDLVLTAATDGRDVLEARKRLWLP
jgi:nitrogen fixation protein FixH